MRLLHFLAMLGLIATPASAQHAEDGQEAGASTPPGWIERPSPGAILASYPIAAIERGVSGRADLSCSLSADGVVSDCSVIAEDPAGFGFGASALLLSQRFLMRPAMLDGEPVAATFRTSILFRSGGAYAVDGEEYIVSPRWIAAPSRANIDAVFPDQAEDREGRAVLDCAVRRDGGIWRCSVLSETPADHGFGRAARRLVDRFRLEPVAGRDLSDLRIQVPFQFDLPGTSAQAGDETVGRRSPWRSLPDADAMAAAFPAAARAQDVTQGEVVLRCLLLPDGSATDCSVAEAANPADLGFEEAALTLAERFAVNPWMEDGRPYPFQRVLIPLLFVDTLAEGAADAAP